MAYSNYDIGRYFPKNLIITGRDVLDLKEKKIKPKTEKNSDYNDGYIPSTPKPQIPGDSGDKAQISNRNVPVSDKNTPSQKQKTAQENPDKTPSAVNKETFSTPKKSSNNIVTINILHTNDMHGHLLPSQGLIEGQESPVQFGGKPAMASIIKNERAKAVDSGQGFLLVDSGDMAMGTSISGMFQGKPVMEVMNNEQYDAATLGNHDFDWGLNTLQDMISQAKFPVVSSNIKKDGKPLPNTAPFIIKEVAGVKVGIVGVITPETKNITSQDEVKSLEIEEPIDNLKAMVPQMKEQGADLIVVLSHAGLNGDKVIARHVPGIDLIVGGHSHDALEEPLQVDKTLIVQAGFGGKNIGKIQMEWDPEKKKTVSYKGELIPLYSDSIEPDKEVNGIIDKYKVQVDKMMNRKLGKTHANLTHQADGRETPLGDLITDMMREKTGAEFALLNSGSIRSHLMKGDITYGDIYNIMPFDSQLVTVKMKGEDIKEALEMSAGKDADQTLQISGMRVLLDSGRPQGDRILEIRSTDTGRILEPYKEYTVATIDFLAKGGDHYDMFTRSQQVTEKETSTLQEVVAKTVSEKGTLSKGRMGRFSDAMGMSLLGDQKSNRGNKTA